MSHPYKNTLLQYNSVARCKIFTIKNCTILTYVTPSCTIPGQKLSADYYSEHADAIFLFLVLLILAKMTKSQFLEHKNTLVTNKCDEGFLSGANTRIRTGDLILTKDVLCRLSHISKLLTVINYIIPYRLCQGKFSNF